MTLTGREDQNRRLLRARDAMDRDFAQPLDVPGMARLALMSPAHFSRTFRETFGETPHRYLQRRRIERAASMLRHTRTSVTEIALAVGFESLGTFSRTFREVMGRSPSELRAGAVAARARAGGRGSPIPVCFVKTWTRPSSFG